jgi:hypothetical protein
MPKKAAVRLWHRARRASLIATAVLHALGLLNFATGRLDPSYAAIARKANVCERTVATALARTTETRESFIWPGAVPRAGATGASCWMLAGATNPERFSPLARI